MTYGSEVWTLDEVTIKKLNGTNTQIVSGETPHQEASSKSASSDAASTWSDGFTPFCIWHLNANWSKPCMRYWKLGNPVTCCWTSRHTNRGATCVRNIRKWKKSRTTEWRPKSPSTLTTPRPKRRNSLIHDKLTRRVVGPNRTLSCKGTDSHLVQKNVCGGQSTEHNRNHTHTEPRSMCLKTQMWLWSLLCPPQFLCKMRVRQKIYVQIKTSSQNHNKNIFSVEDPPIHHTSLWFFWFLLECLDRFLWFFIF